MTCPALRAAQLAAGGGLLLACAAGMTDTGPVATTADETTRVAGVDTSDLTAREQHQWSESLKRLMAPCPAFVATLHECVTGGPSCAACLPAARLLVQQVRLGKTTSQVEAAFQARFGPTPPAEIPTDGSPFKGAPDAPVTVVEWADFQCPFCARTSLVLDNLVKRFDGSVRVVFKHYPLHGHPQAERAARAAVAAQRQGRFWEMHDALFDSRTTGLSEAGMRQIASDLGLDMERFEADWESQETRARIDSDRELADRLGLDGTPMLYVDGRYFDHAQFDITTDLAPWVTTEIALLGADDSQAASAPEAATPRSETP